MCIRDRGCENLTHEQFLAELGEYDHDRVKFLTCQDVDDEFTAARGILKEPVSYTHLTIWTTTAAWVS